jgi:hypothetical protein
MVSHPVPFRKPIEPEKERMPLNFDRPEPSTGKRLGAGHQCAPGMAPKPRDPAVDAAIEAYLAKHRNRTRLALPLSVEGLPSGRQLKQAAQMQSKFLLHDANGKVVRPQQIDHSAIANELETFPWKDGITRIPTGFATTKYGRAAALAFAGYAPAKGLRVAYDRQANADHQHYRRRQAAGSSGHNSAQEVRAAVYSDGSNLSLLGGFSTLLPMPADRYCAYTKCTNGSFAGRPCRAALDPDRHIDVKYCDRDCAQKHRRLLAKDKTRVANEPLKPQIFCVIEEPANDVIDIVDVYSPVKPDVICENTYREGSRNFRDDPIGQLAAHGEITEAQYNAAVEYMADIDEVGARLRAPHRDEMDISVWIPRAPDSNAVLATEIKHSKYPSPLARIRAANKAMGREATAALHATLASNTIDDVHMLRVALDQLIASRELIQWTQPREKSATRSTSPSAVLQGSES